MRFKLAPLLFLALFTWIPLTADAQTNTEKSLQNRIKVAYGDASYVSLASAFYGALIGGSGEISTFGSLSVGYRRVSNNSRWAFGGDLNYTGVNQKYESGSKISYNFYSIIPTVEHYYLNAKIVRLYGTIGVGPMIDDSGSFGAAFQISPIALRVGTKRIAGFVELGIGYKGIANFGVEIGF